jgi:ubiquinone/menaquinone biosynthesis methyltransferase
MIEVGVPVTVARVYNRAGEIGTLHFDKLPGEFPFILTLPQSDAVRMLRDMLAAYETVTFMPGTELTAVSEESAHVVARVLRKRGHTETISAAWLAGCDGRYSVTRKSAGFASEHKLYRPSFVMADYADPTDWGAEARLFFTSRGSLESFPLPGNTRRWVALLPPAGTDDPGGFLEEQVARLAHVRLHAPPLAEPSTFQPERLLVRKFVKDRIVLAGDAAHVMSPIGGQGMNTGLGDADRLAPLLAGIHRGELPANSLKPYARTRRQVFRGACRRNAIGMWLGILTGRCVSSCRGFLLHCVLSRPAPTRRLALHFAMIAPRAALACRDRLSSPERKRELNVKIFSAIAPEYPWMTGVLSLGRDAAWKRNLVRDLPDVGHPVCVDLACGNGDIAALLRDRFPDAQITAIDITPAMLTRARERLAPKGVRCEQRDMMRTGLTSNSIDIVTIAYGLRNAPELCGALAEVNRILRPGGCLGVLDFSKYNARWASAVELFLLRVWGGLWGWLRTRNPETYGYIAKSLAAFPRRQKFHALLKEYGFEIQSTRRGFFGFVEMLVAQKRGGRR